jgi:hypothetical protein
MLTLMLNLRFKCLKLMSFFIGITITKNINKKSSFPMLLKSYNHFHQLFKAKSFFISKNDEDSNLNIFEMVFNISEPTKELY